MGQDPLRISRRPKLGSTTNQHPLRRFYLHNIRGLKTNKTNKVPLISDLAHDPAQPASLIALTETWLHDHTDAEVAIQGFHQPFRGDRIRKKARRGRASGGVIVYVHEELAAEQVFEYRSGVIECIGVMVESLNLMTYTVYRQPDEPNHRSTCQHFTPFITKLNEHISSLPTPTPDVIIQGDLNLPHAEWDTGECRPGPDGRSVPKDEKNMVKALYDLTLTHFLVQQVEGATQAAGNTLDLIFTNNSAITHSLDINPLNPSVSDHNLISLDANYKGPDESGEPSNPDDEEDQDSSASRWRKLNFFSPVISWETISKDISDYNWSREFRDKDVVGMHQGFLDACLSICERHIPLRKPKQADDPIPKHRQKLMRNRLRILKSISSARGSTKTKMKSRLIEIEASLRVSREQQCSADEAKAASSIKENPKYFFTYANKHSKVRTGVGPLRTPDKSLTNSPSKMAGILADQYNSAFSQPVHVDDDPSDLFAEPAQECRRSSTTLENIEFGDEDLAEAMRELRANAAAGPDGVPAALLKYCSDALAPPLASIWRQALNEGVTPPSCKSALIVPIHKGKSKAVAKNYRPVALTSQLSKVFEKVVRKYLVSFMDENVLFNRNQHGFRAGRSCLSQLLAHFDTITAHLEAGRGVDVVYLDFAKAFDKVDIGIVLRKLHLLGVRGRLGRWLASFLMNRTQTVVVSQAKSAPQPVISGVPQGSVLGPLIFLILLADIDEDVTKAFISSFADDTRVGLPISCNADPLILQGELERIYNWAQANNMQFNSDKFEMMRYQAHPKQPRAPQTLVSDDGTAIEEMSYLRDLGVTLSNDASFSQHIKDRVSTVRKLSGWALRTFKSRSAALMLTIWKSLILCHIDYCSQLWSPFKVGEIQAIELLQKSFVAKIAGMRDLNYWQQLKALKLFSLERRRERYSIIYTWRVLEGHVPNLQNTPITARVHIRRGRECAIPALASAAHPSVKAIRYNTLAFRGPRLFNSLPMEVRNMSGCSVDQFKSKLDRHLTSIPDEPLIPGLTQLRQVETNSIVDWAVRFRRDDPPADLGRD